MDLQKNLVSIVLTKQEANDLELEINRLIRKANINSVLKYAKEYPNMKQIQYLLMKNFDE